MKEITWHKWLELFGVILERETETHLYLCNKHGHKERIENNEQAYQDYIDEVA